MTNPTPTPAHQAFREKRAEEFAKLALSINCKYSPEVEREQYRFGILFGFKNGMEAEHEVAYAMGAIMILEAAMKRHNRENIDNFLTENLESAREHLAALLEGK